MFDFMRRSNPKKAKKKSPAKMSGSLAASRRKSSANKKAGRKVFFYDPSGYKSVIFWVDGNDIALANKIGNQAARESGSVMSPKQAGVNDRWPDKVMLRIAADSTDKISEVQASVSAMFKAAGYEVERAKKSASKKPRAKKTAAQRAAAARKAGDFGALAKTVGGKKPRAKKTAAQRAAAARKAGDFSALAKTVKNPRGMIRWY